MRFLPTDEQRDFARSLDAMLSAADTPTAIRAWAAGDPGPGRAVWRRLGEAGVFGLAAPEAYEGVGPLPVELAHAFVESGRHAVPGPLVETVAATALLAELAERGEPGPAKRLLPGLVAGGTVATLVLAQDGLVLDPDAADLVLVVAGDELRIARGHGELRISADPVRRLARPAPGGELLAAGPGVVAAARQARRWALLATAAQSLGVGLALLDRTVAYAKQRTQFGAAIASFQAVKHRLGNTLIGLEFARPLLFGAALTFEDGDLAAAKVAAGEAAYAAAATALQLHGAIGYTEELDLSLWLRKARPLRDAWGSPSWCRERVLAVATGPTRPHGRP
ncbi:acyl-CoA dehydrogenase family protein [Streptomyces sp. NBC_01353]|uniref:acyl-CoA dehydrogenase family protein n=1 Tax=Streptomyces sp. NBC_01353 TaxID=2903835 RepID=UPI002E30FC49|nr:acyl-CoA dehydrogenase family protein [Streptomyces sp. NBC_01353]